MTQDSEKYYLIFEDWSMDPNQWSMLLDSGAVLLAIFGVLLGFLLYKKQRRDSAKDAFEYFQSSLPELRQSIEKAITDLKEFNRSLDLENFVNPILSASLNDKFLNKINLVHLNTFYTNYRKEKVSNFKKLLIDSNFFGDYHSYITKEINYFRSNYLEKKDDFNKWQLLRSEGFFSITTEDKEAVHTQFKQFYKNWVTSLNRELNNKDFDNQDEAIKIEKRDAIIKNKINELYQDLVPFVESNESANDAHILSFKIISAHHEMTKMKAKINSVLEKDIAKFEDVLDNLNKLIEDHPIESK